MANISDKTLGKLVSLAILAVGLAIGFICGAMYHPQQEVHAQAVAAPTPNIQEIQPGFTTGTIGANLVMAHEIAADKHLDRYVQEFAFRLNDGNVKRHTMDRLDSFITATSGMRLTYERLTA